MEYLGEGSESTSTNLDLVPLLAARDGLEEIKSGASQDTVANVRAAATGAVMAFGGKSNALSGIAAEAGGKPVMLRRGAGMGFRMEYLYKMVVT